MTEIIRCQLQIGLRNVIGGFEVCFFMCSCQDAICQIKGVRMVGTVRLPIFDRCHGDWTPKAYTVWLCVLSKGIFKHAQCNARSSKELLTDFCSVHFLSNNRWVPFKHAHDSVNWGRISSSRNIHCTYRKQSFWKRFIISLLFYSRKLCSTNVGAIKVFS